MTKTTRAALAALTAASIAAGGYFTVSTTTRTSAGITFSNRLTPAKDGRVIRSTVVPKATWRGGQTWTITIAHVNGLPVESLTVRAPAMRKYQFVDSVFAPFPACVPYRVTVKPDTVLTPTGRVSTRKDSLTARLSLCRPYTVKEAAWVDSFPVTGWRVSWCGGWARRMTLAQLDSLQAERLRNAKSVTDSTAAFSEIASARLRPDSMPLIERTAWGKDDTLQAEVGYVYRMTWLAKNRVTGRVHFLYTDDDTLRYRAECERERAAYERAPVGRTP
jgi:hypothetical protein